jgi:hypothetical protein
MRFLIPLLIATPALADDATALSARIDERIAAGWVKGKVERAPAADDAEFFRRLCLDLTGRIPSVAMVRDFLDDDRPDKRRLWADELLDGPDFADRSAAHFANYWRAVFLAQANPQLAVLRGRLEDWLKKKLRANTPYDQLVRDLFTDPAAGEYYTAYEGKAENVAGSTARSFLGIRLECAQCHADRSGGTWTQEQFWQYAAFFSRMPGYRIDGNRVQQNVEVSDAPPRIKVAETEKFVTAKYLDGSPLDWKAGADPRAVLADWLTRPENKWFARAAVNRVWHGFFGVGLIDPVDGLGAAENAPSHPELLDDLAKAFVEHRFDLKFLVRAIVGTKAYQRTSRQTHPSQADPRLFARMPTRGLSAEQLFDSLVEATGYVPPAENTGRYGIGPATSPRALFLAKFQTHPDQPIDTATSIQQALNLMNGSLATAAMGPDGSRILKAVADGRGTPADQIGELFLAVLSRQPTEAEQRRLVGYVEAAKDKKAALADVFWALLNSTEFAVNH